MSARHNRSREAEERVTLLAALALIVGVLAITYVAFSGVPFGSPYKVDAIVSSANQLQSGSPVRIAGVDVGQVDSVAAGPGNTSKITLRLKDEALPLHSDATLKIRPRLFLEGGFYVDLKAGSPSAPKLDDGATLPLPQTAVPVQLNDVLSSLDSPVRTSFKELTTEFRTAVSDGGAENFRRFAPNLAPALKDLAWVTRAARGTAPHDVSELVANAAKLTTATADNDTALAGLIVNLNRTAQALNAGDGALGRSVVALDRLTKVAPPALAGVDRLLPDLARFSRTIRPGLKDAPLRLREISASVADLASLVTPAQRTRVVGALRVTFQNLPQLVNRLAALFPVTKPTLECLSSHVVPTFNAKVDDGALSTGQPVWQEFAHALVGFAGMSQNFDGNGYNARYGAGLSAAGLSVDAIPGLGQIFQASGAALQSRPVWLGNQVEPPYRPDANCNDQPLPTFSSKTRSASMRRVSSKRNPPKVTPAGLRKLLGPANLKRFAKEVAAK